MKIFHSRSGTITPPSQKGSSKLHMSFEESSDPSFSGFRIEQYVLPNLKIEKNDFVTGNFNLYRERSATNIDGKTPHESKLDIISLIGSILPSVQSLTPRSSKLKLCLVNEDNLLTQYISWGIEQDSRLNLLKPVRIDFRDVINFIGGDNFDREVFKDLNRFTEKFVKNENPSFRDSFGSNNNQIFILENFDKIIPLIGTSKYDLLGKLIKHISVNNNLIVSTSLHYHQDTQKIFDFNFRIRNLGYDFHDVKKYIRNVVVNSNLQHKIINFFEENPYIYKLSQDPKILQKIIFLLKDDQSNFNIAKLYIELFFNPLREPNKIFDLNDLFNQRSSLFIKKLAFESLETKSLSAPNSPIKRSISSSDSSSSLEEKSLSVNLGKEISSETFKKILNEMKKVNVPEEKVYHFLFYNDLILVSNPNDNSQAIIGRFKDQSIQFFLVAKYIANYYLASEHIDIVKARSFVVRNALNPNYKLLMRFIINIIDLTSPSEIKKNAIRFFLDDFKKSNEYVIKIYNNNLIKQYMYLLNEVKSNEIQEINDIREKIDSVILPNLDKWRDAIKETKYSSPQITSKLFELLSGSRSQVLEALHLLKKIEIREQNNLLNHLVFMVNSIDDYIAERAFEVLGNLEWSPRIMNILQNAVMQEKENLALMAVEVLAKHANTNSISILQYTLNESNSPQVIFTTIISLEHFACIKIYKENIVDILLKRLSLDKELSFLNSHQIILSLKALNLKENEIIDSIIKDYREKSIKGLFSQVIDNFSLLIHSFSPVGAHDITEQIYKDFVEIRKLRFPKFTNKPELFNLKARAIIFLSKNFKLYSKNEQAAIYSFIDDKTKHKNEVVSREAVASLENLFSYKPDETYLLLIKFISGAHPIMIKQAALSAITNSLIHNSPLKPALVNGFIANIIENLTAIKEISINRDRIKSLKELFHILTDEQKGNIIQNLIDVYPTIDKKSYIINFFSDIFITLNQNDKDKIFEQLLLIIGLESNIEDRILTIKSLSGLFNYFSEIQQINFSSRLHLIIANDNYQISLKQEANQALDRLQNPVESLLPYAIINSASEDQNIKLKISHLIDITHHQDSSIDEYILAEINNLYGPIFLTASKTSSVINLKLLSKLINRVDYNQEIIELIAQNIDEKRNFKRTHKALFTKKAKSPLLEGSNYNSRSANRIFEILNQEYNEDSLIIINRDKIIIDNNEFILDGDIDERINNINLFLKHLKDSNINYILPPQQNDYILDKQLGFIDINNVRISLIEVISGTNEAFKKLILLEEKTPFGSTLYTILHFSGDSIRSPEFYLGSHHFSLKSIFGNGGEGISINFKVYYILSEQKDMFLSNIQEAQNYEKISQICEDIASTKKTLRINYNNLFENFDLERRIEALEIVQDDIKNQVSELKFDQETIKQTLEFIEVSKNKKAEKFDSPYKEHLYYYIRSSLNEIFLAAKVINAPTNMIKNDRKGVAGYFGSICKYISHHIPIAGIGVDIIGSSFSLLDSVMQTRLVNQISSLAVDTNEMNQFADEFAKFILDKQLDPNKISINEFLDILEITESAIQNIEDGIDETVKIITAKVFEHSSDPVEHKAKKDGKKIINFIINLLAGDKLSLSNNFRENLLTLEDTYMKSCFPLILPKLPSTRTVRSISLDNDYDSPFQKTRKKNIPNDQIIRSLSSDQIDRMESQEDFCLIKGDIDLTIPTQETFENPGYNNIPNSPKATPLLIEVGNDFPQNNNGLIGGIIMNGASVMPQVEYLIDKLPLANNITDYLPVIKYVNPYKHYIYSAFHIGGNIVYSYNYGTNPIYSLTSSTVFCIKPYIYSQRDQLLEFMEMPNILDPYIPHKAVKFSGYILADSFISLSIALPFIPLTPYAVGFSLLQGASMSMVNYYYSENINKGNIVGDLVGLGATAYTALQCYYFAQPFPGIISKIIVAEACIPVLASTHYLAKFAGDIVGEGLQYAKDYFIGGASD